MTDRDPQSGKFLPGNKANPGGRPRNDLVISALIDEVVKPDDWRFIIGELKKRARRGDVKATEMLMDRRFGKAIQAVEHGGEGGGPIRIEIVYADNTLIPTASP
jgi:hypothetical protein